MTIIRKNCFAVKIRITGRDNNEQVVGVELL